MKHKLLSKASRGAIALSLAAILPLATPGTALASCTWSGLMPPFVMGVGAIPEYEHYSDPNDVSVGTKFRVNGAPYITGVQIYKTAPYTETTTVGLAVLGGSTLATKGFSISSESPTTGWRTVTFDSPVPVREGVDYVVWSHLPDGGYAVDPSGGPQSFYNRGFGGPTALVTIEQGSSGYYKYTSSGTAQPDSAVSHNYWVGPVASDAISPADVSSFSASDNSAGPSVSWSNPAYDSNPTHSNVSYAVYTNTYRTTGGTTTLIDRRDGEASSVSFNDATALPGTSYTYSSKSVDACGNESTGVSSSSVVTSSQTLERLFSTNPASTDASTEKQVVGMHWQTSTAGNVWGARIYRAANTWPTAEPLKVMLWDNDGTLLASRTLQAYSEQSGWIDVRFSSPVSVSANHDYVVGYYTPNGQNVYTNDTFLNGAVTNGSNLSARQNTLGTPNGVYAQGSGVTNTTFPTNQAPNSTWYGVDVDFYIP